MNKQTEIEKELAQLPILEYVFFKPEEIIFSKEVRDLCQGNSCGMYHTTWACPPAVGSVESCMEKCQAYDKAMLFTTATEVTGVAGRGIGMDVVRSEVNALGGRIETHTEPGRGTCQPHGIWPCLLRVNARHAPHMAAFQQASVRHGGL